MIYLLLRPHIFLDNNIRYLAYKTMFKDFCNKIYYFVYFKLHSQLMQISYVYVCTSTRFKSLYCGFRNTNPFYPVYPLISKPNGRPLFCVLYHVSDPTQPIGLPTLSL